MYESGQTLVLVDSPISCYGLLELLAVSLDDLLWILQRPPECSQLLGDGLGVVRAEPVRDLLNHVVVDVHQHARPPPLKPSADGCPGMKQRGISFDEDTYKRLLKAAGEDHLSPLVRRYCWWGLEADAELGKRGILIDDPDERMEFLLDRLEEGLDAWNA